MVSALVVMPAAGWLAGPIGGSMAFKLTLWADLLIYIKACESSRNEA